MSPPKLTTPQVSVLRVDINTGHVLNRNGEISLIQDDHFEIFNSLEKAEDFIQKELIRNNDWEFVIYDEETNPILTWNRLEKRKLS